MAAKSGHASGIAKRELSMMLSRSVLAATLFGFAAMFTASAAQAQTFSFEVCNKSNLTAYVATSHLVSVSDNRFEVEGWWTVAANSCNTIGTFPEGWFYFYAEATQGNWSGDFPLCVQYPGPFTTIHTGSVTCADSNLKSFTQKQITDSGTFTWTLNP
jgi:uncharacterized membrane protein